MYFFSNVYKMTLVSGLMKMVVVHPLIGLNDLKETTGHV